MEPKSWFTGIWLPTLADITPSPGVAVVLCSREVGVLVVLGVEHSKAIMLFCGPVGGDGVQRLMKTGDGVLV